MSAMPLPLDHLPESPARGEAITLAQGRLQVPATPIIPFIEGDGTGPDIWRASRFVFDKAVERGGVKKVLAHSKYDASDIVAKLNEALSAEPVAEWL